MGMFRRRPPEGDRHGPPTLTFMLAALSADDVAAAWGFTKQIVVTAQDLSNAVAVYATTMEVTLLILLLITRDRSWLARQAQSYHTWMRMIACVKATKQWQRMSDP